MLSGRQGISRSGIKNSQLALLVHSGINDGPGLCAPVLKNKKKIKAYGQLVLLGFDVTTFTPVAYQRHSL